MGAGDELSRNRYSGPRLPIGSSDASTLFPLLQKLRQERPDWELRFLFSSSLMERRPIDPGAADSNSARGANRWPGKITYRKLGGCDSSSNNSPLAASKLAAEKPGN